MARIEAITDAQRIVAGILGDGESFELGPGKVAVMEICTAGGLSCWHSRFVGVEDAERVRGGRAPQFCPAHPTSGSLVHEGVAYGPKDSEQT